MYRSMMQVYVKGSNEAIEFYQKAFDAELLAKYTNEDGSAIMHAELNVYGQIVSLSELPGNETITGNTMQLCLHFGEGKESIVKKIYEVLKEGAKIYCPLSPCTFSPLMVGLIDKYGVNWCIFV